MIKQIFSDQTKLKEICEKYNIIKLELMDEKFYPSELMPDHQLLMLAEFKQGAKIGFIKYFGAANELSALLGEGIQIDLRTKPALRAYHRQEMLDSAIVQYAA